MGSLESCCKSASSFPKNRFFFYTKHLLLSSGSRGNMLFEWYHFTIGIFSFPSQTFFHLKGKEMSFCFFALYFWVLSSSIWISWITSPHTSKNKRWQEVVVSLHEKYRSPLLCQALWGIFACLYFRKELTSCCLYWAWNKWLCSSDGAMNSSTAPTEETCTGAKAWWDTSPAGEWNWSNFCAEK